MASSYSKKSLGCIHPILIYDWLLAIVLISSSTVLRCNVHVYKESITRQKANTAAL